ncbi:helix-turn-helix domain-containing protein [Paenibacillus sp. LMG 31461]|uniref:Helix-turn-helix domain-containing protein n=1 Tax=Paenibacillus plantarum TaxID=2654975 RepID=A0ABX1X5Y2_9BACL|nr:AraC family transcriptional regulator [Paenibacillus plantarum]NOU63840.1 helix-turn-helix domain-containing protein [Paenibacillus plantarum]
MQYERLPLAAGYTIQEKYAQFTDHDLHMHDALEVSIALDQGMKYKIGDACYYAGPGDIFLLRPFEPHWNLTQEEGQPSRWIMLLFSPSFVGVMPRGSSLLTPFYMTKSSPLIPADSVYAQSVKRLALEALEEAKHALPGWELQQQTLMIQMLVHMQRYYVTHNRDQLQEDSSAQGIIQAIEYLMSHWAEEIDMDIVIERSHLKKTWFYTKFREMTGLTPNEFIIRLRLQYAGHLLQSTAKSITDIALTCGFGSASYFNKVFKELQHLTPREYRKR